ncbi:MAG: dihydroorotate dehydrogenase [Candidatus Hadarchaeales archaeon]
MEGPGGGGMSSLSVKVAGLKLRNPLILASGILCNGSLLKRAALEGGAGAVVTKSLTLEKRSGYPTPVIAGFEGGLVNAVGLSNQGYREFLSEELPIAKEGKVPVIVSVAGSKASEFRRICGEAYDAGVDAVELNLSCPHVKRHGIDIGSDPRLVGAIVRGVRRDVGIPIFVKLGLSDRHVDSALSAQKAGADAVVAINTIRAMLVDVYSRAPILSNVYGGMSGPAIRPIALRCVHELYGALSIPVVGCGGVEDWRSAVEFMLVGAAAVQVGSAVAVKGIRVFREIAAGLERYLRRHGFRSPAEMVGMAGKIKNEQRAMQSVGSGAEGKIR